MLCDGTRRCIVDIRVRAVGNLNSASLGKTDDVSEGISASVEVAPVCAQGLFFIIIIFSINFYYFINFFQIHINVCVG